MGEKQIAINQGTEFIPLLRGR
ncbi:hypothetical protein ACNKHK_06915 [Shigella flexneri]